MLTLSEDLWSNFRKISLEEMEKVKLMNRVDTKFIAPVSKLIPMLEMAMERYFVQEIEEKNNMPYFTRYYDTLDYDMYYQHQRGKKVRQKIRTRLYEGTMQYPFLEIKSKNNKGRTRKKRVLMEPGEDFLLYPDFFNKYSDYQAELLVPTLENHFYRVTLVNHTLTERITLDTDLEIFNLQTGSFISLDKIAIIEWKRDGRAMTHDLENILRTLRIPESGFSKYCVGIAMTDKALPSNRLKQKIRMIEKMQN